MSSARGSTREGRPSLWFVVPAHGRLELSAICFRALAWTCRELVKAHGIDATACIVACDGNLDLARESGFATVERDNAYLGARVNDGFEFAASEGVDFAVTLGSDDWLDPRLFADLPPRDRIGCSRLSAAVSEDGRRLVHLRIPYEGGDGVRVFPVELLRQVGYRPAIETRQRGIDGSIRDTFDRALGWMPCVYRDRHPLQIVDFKSRRDQLTSFGSLTDAYAFGESVDPWEDLAGHFPAGLVDAMAAHYGAVLA